MIVITRSNPIMAEAKKWPQHQCSRVGGLEPKAPAKSYSTLAPFGTQGRRITDLGAGVHELSTRLILQCRNYNLAFRPLPFGMAGAYYLAAPGSPPQRA